MRASASDAANRKLAFGQHAWLTKRDRFVLSLRAGLQPIDTGETTMVSFKTLAAAVLLSATAATPAFAQAPVSSQYIKNLQDSGYNPKNDFNPNGTMRAAIQEPGLFAFYYPNLDVLNGGAPTPAARLSPDWPALKGACAAIGGGVTYCGDHSGSYDFAPGAFSGHHGRRHHRK
jgi:hypothetical protein